MFWDKPRIVIGLEASVLLSLGLSVIYAYSWSQALLIAQAAPLLLLALLLSRLRADRDFPKYALVFGYLAFVVVAVPLLLRQYPLPGGLVYLVPILLALVFAMGLAKKRFVEGTVVTPGEVAVVLIDYDLFGNARQGHYAAENRVGAKKGDRVRLALKKSFTRQVPAEIKEIVRGKH